MNHDHSTPRCTLKNQQATNCCLEMDPEMNTSETRVLLQGAVKIFEAGLKSKTWDCCDNH